MIRYPSLAEAEAIVRRLVADLLYADALCDRLAGESAEAHRAFIRNRSAARRAAMEAAGDRFLASAEVCRDLRGQIDRADTMACRLALVAARRTRQDAQGSLFAGLGV